jgi:CRP-like cAMP-binding protein
MTDGPLLEDLKGVRFLEGTPEEDLRQIASVARFEEYRAGAVLFREGAGLDRIFLVAEGRVSLEVNTPAGPRRLHTVGEGELLAWSPLLNQQPMTAGARALTPVRVIALDAAQVLALCHHDPRFGFTLMRRTAEALAQRLSATRLHLLDVYRQELPAVAGPEEGAPG